MIKEIFSNLIRGYRMFVGWQSISQRYDLINSPARVSAGDILNYRELIRETGVEPKRILILGATPELRLLASDISKEVLVADFSPGMIKKTNSMLPEYVKKKERILEKNWFRLKHIVQPSSIDIIMGDLVMRQVVVSEQDKFLEIMRNIVSPDGSIIMRTNFLNPSWYNVDSERIVSEGINGHLKGVAGAYPTMLFRLYNKCSWPPLYEVDEKCLYQCFASSVENANSEKEKKMAKSLRDSFGKYIVPWNHTPKEVFEDLVKKYFIVRKVVTASDYSDAVFYPTYLLRKS